MTTYKINQNSISGKIPSKSTECRRARIHRLKRWCFKLAEALQVPINPVDIEISHKLYRKGNKPIIVKFVSHKTKISLYKARINLRNMKLPNLFPGTHSPESKDRISIYESLTSYGKKIANEANKMRRDGELLKLWTKDGQIYVKTSPEGRPIRIMELDDLKSV